MTHWLISYHYWLLCIQDNPQISLYTCIKTGPQYVINATNTDTHKQDADEKNFAEIAEKKTTQVTKQIIAKINQGVLTVENDIWKEVTTVK